MQSIKGTKKKNICAPGIGNNLTCFDKKGLVEITKLWNKKNRNQKLKLSNKSNDLWRGLNKKLRKNCVNETCWLKQDFLKNKTEHFKSYFKPEKPSKWKKFKNTWLTTIDIENVLKQYESSQKDFQFIGPVPIDFDYEYSRGECIVDELCKLDINYLKKKKKKNKLGIIFNLDAHNEPGSHWVALYSDFNLGEVYYYDSYGIFPPDEVKILMERMALQGKKLKGKPFKLYYNDIRHQYKNSECGVYSMHFITEFLEGKTFKQIIKNRINDDKMNKKRDYFYNVF